MTRASASVLLGVLLLGGPAPVRAQDKPTVTIPGVDRRIPTDTTVLDLSLPQVTDAGLKELRELRQLTTLGVGGTKVTDEGLKELRKALPECTISR